MDYAGPRKRLVDWIRQQMIGPVQLDEDYLLDNSPLDRYPVGVLHPVGPGISGTDPADSLLWEGPAAEESAGDEQAARTFAEPAAKKRYVPPSAVGFSCFVKGRPRLHITVTAAHYRQERERNISGQFQRRAYRRIPLEEETLIWAGDDHFDTPSSPHFGVDVACRPFLDGAIFTLTLYNRQQIQEWRYTKERIEKCLFEAQLTCFLEAGELAEYPRVDKSLLTEEEQELELQYKDRHIYAVGHGGAVNWTLEEGSLPCIRTEFMPVVEVPQVTTELPDTDWPVLGMQLLAFEPLDQVIKELGRFVSAYAGWVARQPFTQLEEDEYGAALRIKTRMEAAVVRMQRGVALLAEDDLVFQSFQLANQAMLKQMQQNDQVVGKKSVLENYRWRPFQLAFLLVVLESALHQDDDYRDVLDLIWFPTGGGKTEAYLGLTAILILWRRLLNPETGGGTVALMRYTLRLLTAQQFVRATRIIFALELLRKGMPDRLGHEPITVGIWVGKASSPNSFHQAREKVREIHNGTNPPNGLVLSACPWCGTNLKAANYRSSSISFNFHCTNLDCAFGVDDLNPLPCNVVDEALYEKPPSLLIGTIDKFARLAWESSTGAFFGEGTRYQPPSLVIQDELHLITGPLGSVAGLYEAALDTLLQLRGARPKYIASTATIRMAAEQVKNLYGRDLAVFPPPGLSCDDSFFARTDYSKPGRLYIGYFAPMLGKQQCLAPLAASLLVAPQEAFENQPDQQALLEAWWTQVIYHVSLKSVGESHTTYVTEVRSWTQRLSAEQAQLRHAALAENGSIERSPTTNLVEGRALNARIAQLTSIASARQNAETFANLEKPLGTEDCLDVVLATNMVSVGLDVSRLALMVVNSQPFTTADYIQASSRVGRAEVPGLVFVNYHRYQARSLSHYENFRPFHDSFYRFVEPTSVTPYTYQVRSRALHAALVIAIRHAGGQLRKNNAAGAFDRYDAWTQEVIQTLSERCGRSEPLDSIGTTARHLTELADQWHYEAKRCQKEKRALFYSGSDRGADSLLCDHEHPDSGLWPTLHSMRNVENTGVLKDT